MMHLNFHLRFVPGWYFALVAAFLLIVLFPFSIEAQTTTTTTATTASGSWLTFRGNPEHTGVSSLAGPAGPSDSIQVKWRWQVNGSPAPISASPAVTEDGTVIIGTEGGYVAAINQNGGASWIYKVEEPVKSSPSVDESGNVFAVTDDGYIYYLSANGELIWKSDFDRHTDSSPVISGGLAYLGTDNDELLTITLNPDMSNSGGSTKLPPWVVQQSSFLTAGAVHSSPAFSGEAVFVGGGEFVYSLNPNAGGGGGETTTTANGGSTTTTANGGSNTTTTAPSVIKWQYSINGDIYSSPAVSGGKVYVGADNGYLYALSENISENTDTSNVINEGKLLWQRKTGGKIRSSPAVVAPASSAVSTSATAVNMVYVGSDDGALYAFDENGQFKWKFPTSAPISSSPAVDKNGDIYFGSENGSVYALFPDGALKWVYRTRGSVRSSPAIGPDKKLYIGSDDGYLYCIGESDEPNREPDYNIVDTASPDTIENGGNPTIVTAAVTSQSDDPNILSSIASVTLDLTPLLLIDFDTGELVTKVVMLDDGNGQDDFAGDGIFTFAFGITTDLNDPGILLPQDGIYTYLLSLALAEFPVPAVGPVPLMVTVTDIYGHRVSKPFALNIAKKLEGSFTDLYDDQIINGLSNQTLDVSISITSGIVQSITINPNTGTAGSIVQVLITGQNTNFETNKTAVLICNDSNPPVVIASAPPQEPDVQVFDSTLLTAQLSIKDNTVVNSTGIWDVKVITDLGDCPEFSTNLASFCTALPTNITNCEFEIVVAKDAFTISSTAAQTAALQQSASPDQKDFIIGAQEQCQLEFSMLNPSGAFAKDTPFNFASGYPREFAVPLAANGTWTVNLSSGTCVEGQSFKISTTGSNFGLLTGQVTNGITGERIDDVTIAAIIGDLSNIPLDLTKTSNSTKSSGGGYYMLPLAATRDKYTVFATKDGLIDIRNYVVIEDKKESTLNFSLKLDLSCPVTTALKEGNLNNFYAFRDKVLLKNPQGKRWVALYYRHSAEVTDIILKHPDFRKKAAAFIMKAALESRKMLKGEKADSRMRAKLEELINSLIKVGSPELRNSLLTEKKAILGFIEPSAK